MINVVDYDIVNVVDLAFVDAIFKINNKPLHPTGKICVHFSLSRCNY